MLQLGMDRVLRVRLLTGTPIRIMSESESGSISRRHLAKEINRQATNQSLSLRSCRFATDRIDAFPSGDIRTVIADEFTFDSIWIVCVVCVNPE